MTPYTVVISISHYFVDSDIAVVSDMAEAYKLTMSLPPWVVVNELLTEGDAPIFICCVAFSVRTPYLRVSMYFYSPEYPDVY